MTASCTLARECTEGRSARLVNYSLEQEQEQCCLNKSQSYFQSQCSVKLRGGAQSRQPAAYFFAPGCWQGGTISILEVFQMLLGECRPLNLSEWWSRAEGGHCVSPCLRRGHCEGLGATAHLHNSHLRSAPTNLLQRAASSTRIISWGPQRCSESEQFCKWRYCWEFFSRSPVPAVLLRLTLSWAFGIKARPPRCFLQGFAVWWESQGLNKCFRKHGCSCHLIDLGKINVYEDRSFKWKIRAPLSFALFYAGRVGAWRFCGRGFCGHCSDFSQGDSWPVCVGGPCPSTNQPESGWRRWGGWSIGLFFSFNSAGCKKQCPPPHKDLGVYDPLDFSRAEFSRMACVARSEWQRPGQGRPSFKRGILMLTHTQLI